MKKMSFAKSLATMGLAAVCAVGIVGCSEGTGSSDKPTYTGGVAATVNGTEIEEDAVTQAVQDIRAQMSLTDEDSWGEWLSTNGYTPESVREEIINGYIDQELVKQGSESMGVTANPDEVTEYIETMKGHYDDDDAWKDALQSVGITEEEYRENIELSLVSQQLKTKVAENAAESTDEDALKMATEQGYLASFNGAKKSSHILFDSNDEATAQEVLDKINAGELDFAEAAATYSQDSSKDDGGNVGWNNLNNFVSEYSDALNGLEKGQVSGLVPSTYGIHIIMCTDVYEAPEELTSLDQLPAEFQEALRSAVKASNESQAYYTWLQEQRDAAEIVINDMPEGLPYYVDMTKYAKDEGSEGAEGQGDAAPAEGDAAGAEGSDGEGADGAAPAEGEGEGEGAEGAGDGEPAAESDAQGEQGGEQPTAGGDADAQTPAESDTADQPAEGQQPAEGAAE